LNLNLNLWLRRSQAVPTCPSGKGSLGGNKAFGNGESMVDVGVRRGIELDLSAFVHSFECVVGLEGGGRILGEILMLIWGATLGRNFCVNFGRAAWEACNATQKLGNNSAFAVEQRKTKRSRSSSK
jgi:hypothetical protein